MDPLRHPDLIHLGRRLRQQLDETLEAEQLAAAAAARRRRTLREHLLEAEDRGAWIALACSGGQRYQGVVRAVGADHLVLGEPEGRRLVALAHLVAVEIGG